ncbi:MAG: hypothetical protein KGM17_04415 [Sphingomonadales bacterium]|nr:hypothetical protein [Sphingomonadales bacterium]
MIRSAIRAAVAVLALPLAACNVVVSQHPWFTAGADDPRLAPGLWVALQNDACTFDATRPLASWPECAKPFFVRGRELLSPPEPDKEQPARDAAVFADPARWQSSTPVIVAGNPMVMELRADVVQPASEPAPKFYLYLALQPLAQAADGTLQALRIWPVFCGPPPPPSRQGETQTLDQLGSSGVSKRLFPGLKRAKVGCEASGADAIRKAAALSEGVAAANEMPPFKARWLRPAI